MLFRSVSQSRYKSHIPPTTVMVVMVETVAQANIQAREEVEEVELIMVAQVVPVVQQIQQHSMAYQLLVEHPILYPLLVEGK